MMDPQRKKLGQENAKLLIDEHLDAERNAQERLDFALVEMAQARADRTAARNAARSERTRWAAFDLPPLVWAEDAETEAAVAAVLRDPANKLIAEDCALLAGEEAASDETA